MSSGVCVLGVALGIWQNSGRLIRNVGAFSVCAHGRRVYAVKTTNVPLNSNSVKYAKCSRRDVVRWARSDAIKTSETENIVAKAVRIIPFIFRNKGCPRSLQEFAAVEETRTSRDETAQPPISY
eukprot:1175776-Prorocentrum_minimum.AAC.2